MVIWSLRGLNDKPLYLVLEVMPIPRQDSIREQDG
jgi:hypothetical protein